MKIAVLIYGRLDKCIEHYSNIISSIGVDHEIHFFLSSDNSPKEVLENFIILYKPIKYTNEKIYYDCDLSKYPNKPIETNIPNMTCHFINKGRVFKLLEEYVEEENVNYDVVISLRVDLLIYNNFTFHKIKDNTIYLPNCYDWGGVNDQIAYGNISVMKKYMNIFENVITILDQRLSKPHPESLTLANIQLNNLEVDRFNLHYRIDR